MVLLAIFFSQSCNSNKKISYEKMSSKDIDCEFEVVRELTFISTFSGGYAPPNFKIPYINEYANFYKEEDTVPYMHYYTLISDCYGAGVQSIYDSHENRCREIYFQGDSLGLFRMDTIISINPVTLEKTIKQVEEYYYKGEEIYDSGWYPCKQIKKLSSVPSKVSN